MASTAQYYKQEPERSMRNDIVMLLAMCAFAFFVLGSFIAIKMIPDSEIKVGSFFSTYFDNRDDSSFMLGSVKLGTSIDQVRNRHANVVKGVTADGSITMAFLDGNERYIVWYGEDGPTHVAYKARQSQTLPGVSEDDFIGSIAERYGAPSLSSCSRRITDGMRDCQFSWWIPGEVRMDVNSRQDPRATQQSLQVTMQITDTRQEGRMRRTAQRTSQLSSAVKTY